MKQQKKFVYLTPLSFQAKVDFSEKMNLFHSCEVIKEDSDRFLITTLNQEHTFWIPKKGNEHWNITL